LAASAYTAITLLMLWILPLFSATPLLGPIYNPITHMVPPPFPLILIVPAVAFDLLLGRGGDLRWRIPVAGIAFIGVLLLVQWPLANFMVHSPLAHSPWFGADTWNYNNRLGPWQHEFWNMPTHADASIDYLAIGFGVARAMLYACITAAVGVAFGQWLARVRR
jgi:hypothetical protein